MEYPFLMAQTRLTDWQPRFHAVLDDFGKRPMIWGESDCCMFGAAVVEALTGEDMAAQWRGTYSSKIEAAAWLRDKGYKTLEGMLSILMGMPQPIFHVRRGDIVLDQTGHNIGVCNGHKALFMSDVGFAPVPVLSCKHFYPVGW